MATPNSLFTSGQILTASQVNNFPFGYMAGVRSTTATSTPTTSAEVSFLQSTSFTPVTNRIYRVSWAVGSFIKNAGTNNQDIYIRVGSSSGTIIDHVLYSGLAIGYYGAAAKVGYVTTAQIGTTSSTSLFMTVANNGTNSAATFTSDANSPSLILIEDIGTA